MKSGAGRGNCSVRNGERETCSYGTGKLSGAGRVKGQRNIYISNVHNTFPRCVLPSEELRKRVSVSAGEATISPFPFPRCASNYFPVASATISPFPAALLLSPRSQDRFKHL